MLGLGFSHRHVLAIIHNPSAVFHRERFVKDLRRDLCKWRSRWKRKRSNTPSWDNICSSIQCLSNLLLWCCDGQSFLPKSNSQKQDESTRCHPYALFMLAAGHFSPCNGTVQEFLMCTNKTSITTHRRTKHMHKATSMVLSIAFCSMSTPELVQLFT
jgi:hypothetical protein